MKVTTIKILLKKRDLYERINTPHAENITLVDGKEGNNQILMYFFTENEDVFDLKIRVLLLLKIS